jgi:alpha-glucoside transport system substrate-binding protein
MTSRRATSAVALLLVVVLTGCGATARPTASAADDGDVLEVFTPYRDREADAFRAVLDVFTARTGVEARHVGTAAFADRLRERVRDGDPPDVALFPQLSVFEQLARSGQLAEVDGDRADVGATLLPGAERIGVVDGERFGVWYRLSVKSLVWYPPAAFAAAGHTVPRTLDELLALTDRIEAGGTPPWCMGMEAFDSTGWVGTDWIEDIVLRRHGADMYDDWADGRIGFTDPRIAASFAEFGDIALEEGRVRGGVRAILSVPALEAIMPMLDDPPGCLLSRQASFQEAALPDDTTIGPEGELDVFVLPSTNGDAAPLVAAGDIAAAFEHAHVTGSDSGDEAAALVRFLASPAAGEPWAALGGYTSPHATFDTSTYATPFDRRLARLVRTADVVRFDASDQMPPAVGTGTFWQGVVDYVAGMPLPTVLQEIQAGYADLSAPPSRPTPHARYGGSTITSTR